MARLVGGNRVAVNLVLSTDGGSTINGSSAGLSFPEDRQRFHALRKEFDAILIGGNTARNEPYQKTPRPLIVLSHGELPPRIAANPSAVCWNLPIREAILKATSEYGDLLIEAGPTIVREAIAQGLVTELFLTISDLLSSENPVSLAELTREATEISRERSEGGIFLKYQI